MKRESIEKREIFDFNHIDKNFSEEKIKEITDLYKYYHKRFWCFQKAHKIFKRLNLAVNLSSALLVTTGTIVGGVTLNPIILGTISGAGVLKTVSEAKNYKRKIEMSRFAYTTYEKTLITLGAALRGAEFNKDDFIAEMGLLDEVITDFSPLVCKYEKDYYRELIVKRKSPADQVCFKSLRNAELNKDDFLQK